jgi:RNA polymerase sigma-70 factor (ECF subfamily)
VDGVAVNIRARLGSNPPERVIDAQTLWSRCIGGQPQAWRALHAQYYPVAHAFLRRLGVRPPDVEDVCQEVFVQVFRYLARFEERADFKTWLYKLCISQAGRARRRAALAGALRRVLGRPGMSATLADPQEWAEGETQRRVQRALAAMKPISRTVFTLYELEGLSGEEIARVTDLPLGTIRRRLHHARQEFSALIGEGWLP